MTSTQQKLKLARWFIMVDAIDFSTKHYTPEMWLCELIPYLKDVIGMDDQQTNNEIETRFPDLWETHKASIVIK